MFEEPKDMFEGVVKAPSAVPAPAPMAAMPAAPAPIAPPPSNLPPNYGYAGQGGSIAPEPHRGGMGKIVIIVAVILVVFGVSGYFAYRIMVQPADDSSVVDSVSDTGVISDTGKDSAAKDDALDPSTTKPDATTNTPATTTPATTTSNPASLLDSDGDGLTNARELELGTSVTKSDTDGDGLGDREEVEVYGTNPRKTDTDGDGYLDGQEVAGGYNPNGEGKLFGTVPSGS
jgi:hypothetical protein